MIDSFLIIGRAVISEPTTDVMFLPQKPHLTIGSLADQVHTCCHVIHLCVHIYVGCLSSGIQGELCYL